MVGEEYLLNLHSSSSSRSKTDASADSLREIAAWEKFAREYFAGLESAPDMKAARGKCDAIVDNK